VPLTDVGITNLGPSTCSSPANNQANDVLVDSLAPGETVSCTVTVVLVDPAVSPVDFDITADGGGAIVTDAGQYFYRSPILDAALSNIALDGEAAGSPLGLRS